MTTETKTMTKIEALAQFLDVEQSDLENDCKYDSSLFSLGDQEYIVLTDSQADVRVGDHIRETLWAFRPEFLLDYMPKGLEAKDLSAIQERCEDANPAIRALVGDNEQDLIDDAIGADGRGHFLSGYDGHENEQGDYFIYRTN